MAIVWIKYCIPISSFVCGHFRKYSQVFFYLFTRSFQNPHPLLASTTLTLPVNLGFVWCDVHLFLHPYMDGSFFNSKYGVFNTLTSWLGWEQLHMWSRPAILMTTALSLQLYCICYMQWYHYEYSEVLGGIIINLEEKCADLIAAGPIPSHIYPIDSPASAAMINTTRHTSICLQQHVVRWLITRNRTCGSLCAHLQGTRGCKLVIKQLACQYMHERLLETHILEWAIVG